MRDKQFWKVIQWMNREKSVILNLNTKLCDSKAINPNFMHGYAITLTLTYITKNDVIQNE